MHKSMIDISKYTLQIVELQSKGGRTATGRPIVGATTPIEARFVKNKKNVKDFSGNEYIIDAAMWVKPTQNIELEDIVFCEDEYYKVVQVYAPRTINGIVNHKKILLVQTRDYE